MCVTIGKIIKKIDPAVAGAFREVEGKRSVVVTGCCRKWRDKDNIPLIQPSRPQVLPESIPRSGQVAGCSRAGMANF